MEGLNAFSGYVKTTLNLGSSLKDIDWGGNIDPNYTSSECMVIEVDWGGNLKLIRTSCGCMLIEVDWGGKLGVNHIHEYMPSGVHWGRS